VNQDQNAKIVFWGFFIGVPATYVLMRVAPYLLFYVLPFVILSLLWAHLWHKALSALKESYAWLVIPITGVAIFCIAGFPKDVVYLKNGAALIDGQRCFDWFNAVKGGFDHALWSVIPDGLTFLAPRMPPTKVLYDFNTVRWLLWTSLGVGGPAGFFFHSLEKVRDKKTALEKKYEEAAKEKQRLFDEEKESHRGRIQKIKVAFQALETERDRLQNDNTKLKALAEFKKKALGAKNDGESTEPLPAGVLDSDVL